jgi:hypothetical protein
MIRFQTAQTPRVRMSDYRLYKSSAMQATDMHSKINVRANILNCASPVRDRILKG